MTGGKETVGFEKEKKKRELLERYKLIYICPNCDDFMVPVFRTYTENYRGKLLKLKNFPFKKCVNHQCGVEYFEVQSTKAGLRKARRRNFLNHLETEFDYNEVIKWKE